jgi:hypothetical protein
MKLSLPIDWLAKLLNQVKRLKMRFIAADTNQKKCHPKVAPIQIMLEN